MEQLKDDGIAVVGMKDLSAWRRGENQFTRRAP